MTSSETMPSTVDSSCAPMPANRASGFGGLAAAAVQRHQEAVVLFHDDLRERQHHACAVAADLHDVDALGAVAQRGFEQPACR